MGIGLLGRRGVPVHRHAMGERKDGIGTALTQHLLDWADHVLVIATKHPYVTAAYAQVKIN